MRRLVSVTSARFYMLTALLLAVMSVATLQLYREIRFYRGTARIERHLSFTSGPSMPTLRARIANAKRSHLRRSAGWSVVCAGSAGALWLHLRRFRAPPPQGLCTACGYDLRASPGRCPECGVVPEVTP